MKKLAILFALVCASSVRAQIACDQTTVQNAVNAASPGATITLAAGNCTWTAMNINNQVIIQGAGVDVTNINLPNSTALSVTAQTSGPIRFKNLTFVSSGAKALAAGGDAHVVHLGGPWPTGQGIIFQNLNVRMNGSDFITAAMPGGVIISKVNFFGILGDTLYVGKLCCNSNASWTSVNTIGTADSTGLNNTYIEDTTLNGGNGTDCDDNCRIVFRHNTGIQASLFNSHGADSSPQGMRHFEIYENSFTFNIPNPTACGGNSDPSNMNYTIWIRGGTGVIYNNHLDPLVSQCWGTKPMIKMNIRNIQDDNLGVSCVNIANGTAYPTFHQLGQDWNSGLTQSNPIWVWGNVSNIPTTKPHGFFINFSSGLDIASWGNHCNVDYSLYYQWGRDGINTSVGSLSQSPNGGEVEGQGGTAKPGYTAYTYPHPLVSSGAPAVPVLSFSPSSSAFGTVNVGSTSSPITTTITNVGNATETFSSFSLSSTEYVKTGGTCNFASTLAVSASCTFILTFTPSAQGPRNGTATIGGTVGASYSLTGSGQTSVSVPTAPTGLTTTAAGPNSNLSWTAATGTITGYKIYRSTISGAEALIATTSTTATTYQDAGLSNGTYFWKVAAYNTAGTSLLSNEATATISVQAIATVNPSLVDFGTVPQGQNANNGQTVTVTNTGSATLTISSISISGPNAADFTQTNNCTSLAVGAQCVVSLGFNPSTTTQESASLVVNSNDPTSPDTVTLRGTGIGPVTVSPVSLNFGNQYANKTSASQTVTFTNLTGQTITFTSVALTTGTQFAISVNNCTGTLGSGNNCTVSLTFTPTSTGSKSDTLTFSFTGGSGSGITVALTGKANGHGILKVGAAVAWPQPIRKPRITRI